MKNLLFIVFILFAFQGSFAEEKKSVPLSFVASTIIVSNMVETELDAGPVDFALTDIFCSLSTPTYYYELGGCWAKLNGREIALHTQTAAILAAQASDVDGGLGTAYFAFKSLSCKGESRTSTCVLTKH
jgi:hypothetical protein